MSTDWTAFERRLTLPRTGEQSVSDRVELRAAYAVELDVEAWELMTVRLQHVIVETRDWEGMNRKELRLSTDTLSDLVELLATLELQRVALEVIPLDDAQIAEIEQPDASTGQTFTVDDTQVVVD